jgi:hypothetical protein
MAFVILAIAFFMRATAIINFSIVFVTLAIAFSMLAVAIVILAMPGAMLRLHFFYFNERC